MLRRRLLSRASLLLLPALAWQGRQVRRRLPVVPPAAGDPRGELPGQQPALRVLFLGESPIAGVGAGLHEAGVGGSFARAWAERTAQAVQWQVHGRNGFTAARTRDELIDELPPEPWPLLIVGLGVNDTLSLTRTSTYQRDLNSLVQRARARFGAQRVVLSGLPPVHNFPSLPSPLRQTLGLRAALLDEVTRRTAEALSDCVYVPLIERARPELFCEDGFHPGPLGYRSWGEALANGVRSRWP